MLPEKRTVGNDDRGDLVSGGREEVRDRGRETRPAALVHCEPAEHARKKGDAPETLAVDDQERRRENTSVCRGRCTYPPRIDEVDKEKIH